MANDYNSLDYDSLYAPIKGDETAESFSSIDPIGDAIFGWGNGAWNREIDQRLQKINQARAQLGQKRFATIQEAVDANATSWDQLKSEVLGADGNKLNEFYDNAQASDATALGGLKDSLGDYQGLSGLFDDQNFLGDVGDVSNAATPSQETVGAQKGALQQFKDLSSPKESAEESLMRLTAQRQQEGQERGDREAMAQNLKARGVYGSGAEVLSALMSQGSNANTRSMANAQANANASKRAMSALGSYADLSSNMRNAETQQGSLANQVAMFNNQVNQNTQNTRNSAQLQARNTDNSSTANRAQAEFNATRGVTDATRADLNTKNTTLGNLTQGETNNRTAGTAQLTGAYDAEEKRLGEVGAGLASQKKSALFG